MAIITFQRTFFNDMFEMNVKLRKIKVSSTANHKLQKSVFSEIGT